VSRLVIPEVRRVLNRVITVPREEMEVTEIVHGQSLTDVADAVLGMTEGEVPITRLSDESALKLGKYIAERKAYMFTPLNQIAPALGLDIRVEFYDIGGVPIYFIREPEVTELTKKVYIYLKSRIGEAGAETGADIIGFARRAFEDVGLEPKVALADPDVKSAIYYVWRDLIGYGPMEVPMEDAMVEEVSWYSHDGPILVVDKKVAEVYPNAEFVFTNVFLPKLIDDVKRKFFMSQVIRSVTSRARAGLTTAKPIVEARVPDPSGRGFHRLAAHLDIASRSPGITIRKFPQVKLSLTSLIRFNTLSALEAAYLLYQLLRRGFVLIVGGMASGKTTLLQSLISSLPTMYKVVTIEDTPELSTPAHNWHPLYVRRAPAQSELEDVDFSRLVIHSLRHRGTVVTLGEVRGAEMADLIQAAASGHGAICLRPRARVLVRVGGAERAATMEEVYRMVEKGERVEALSYDLASGGLEWRRVTRAYRVRSGRWVRLHTAGGRVLEATPDHRLPVLAGGSMEVKPAEEVKVGDSLLLAPRIPRSPSKRYVVFRGRYVELDFRLGRLYGIVLSRGRVRSRGFSLPARLVDEKLVELLASVARVRRGKRSVRASARAVELLKLVSREVKASPLSLPEPFLGGVYEAFRQSKNPIPLGDEELAHALHYALRSVGVDSVVRGGDLVLRGERHLEGADPVVKVEHVEEEGDAYDIEVEGTHTFITDSSIVSMNCTFHAQDPDTVLARITSPPINAAPESLLLISSIVHVSLTKTYKEGRPASVRRVMRIFEIKNVVGRRVEYDTVFYWDPMTDEHYPPFHRDDVVKAAESLKVIWEKSRALRILGSVLYGADEAKRALVDVYTLAWFLDEMARSEVLDIKLLLLRLSAFYLRFDELSSKLWENHFKKLLT